MEFNEGFRIYHWWAVAGVGAGAASVQRFYSASTNSESAIFCTPELTVQIKEGLVALAISALLLYTFHSKRSLFLKARMEWLSVLRMQAERDSRPLVHITLLIYENILQNPN